MQTGILVSSTKKVSPDPSPAGRALDALLEIFTYNDFAVKRFLAGYKFCLFEHFRRSPLPSLLCTQDSEARRRRIHRLLTEDQLDRCRALKTFRRFVEADPAARASLLTDSSGFRAFLADSLDRLVHSEYFASEITEIALLEIPNQPKQ